MYSYPLHPVCPGGSKVFYNPFLHLRSFGIVEMRHFSLVSLMGPADI